MPRGPHSTVESRGWATGRRTRTKSPMGAGEADSGPRRAATRAGKTARLGSPQTPVAPPAVTPLRKPRSNSSSPPTSDPNDVWYDVSLVDGYSLAAEIVPDQSGPACVPTNCALSLDQCPQGENDVGDLRVMKNGRAVACLSPCKKWNYPPPFGLGNPENISPGLDYCCPTPPIQPAQCSSGPVIRTQYVDLIHRSCPSAYSYAYDDMAGLHNCPTNTNFRVTFCP